MSPGPPPTGPRICETGSAEATEAVGEVLAASLRPGDVVLLEGDLAAGKTTLVRGLVRALGGDGGEVTSPTFVLLHEYPCNRDGIFRVHHVDLYRLGERVADLREVGIGEILSDPEGIIAVEWPKATLATWIPPDSRVWRITITTEGDDSRRIEIVAPRSRF
jgi:tRNA threonylcarbamoyl adenosine modification protein YjeE